MKKSKSLYTKITSKFAFLLLAILTFSTTFLARSEPVYAQPAPGFGTGEWYNPNFSQFYEKVSSEPQNEIFGERYTLAQVNWIINSLAYLQAGNMLVCFSDPNPGECFESNRSVNSSPLLFVSRLNDGFVSVKPASGIQYVASKMERLSPVQTANAQEGFGFSTLGPLQGLWVTFRNIAYGLMAFAVIVLSFLVILRQKVGPQAVLSVQTALPRIAVAFLFITFSYAISGLIIDLAYLIMALFSAVISSTGSNLFQSQQDPITIFNLLNDPSRAFSSWSIILGAIVTAIGAAGVGISVLTAGLMTVPAGVAGIVGVLLFTLGIVSMFRVFVTMLKAFTVVVFLVIGSPFIALAQIFGAGPGFGGWIKQMVAQLAVFVAICLVMFVSHMMFWTMGPELDGWAGNLATLGANYYNFNTGQIGGNQMIFPGFGGFPIQIMAFFIGFGLIFSAPKIATSVRDQILSGRGSYGFDVGGRQIKNLSSLPVGYFGEPHLDRVKALRASGTPISNSDKALEFILKNLKKNGIG